MSFYDWLLALHVLAGFALVAALVVFCVVVVAGRSVALPSDAVRTFRVARVGDALFAVGSTAVLVLGIWLAIDAEAYQVWDGWIVAAIVLWALAMETGRRTGTVYNAARDRARALVAEGRDAADPELNAMLRSSAGLVYLTATVALVLLLLVIMIYKPGA